ncbi:SHOCT domain-containing protein [Petropleomorpha daqingensis]|uniref:Short C-terminal domain-containing protein n=1 Tax=Petropleomorpha daqingensis TaxID=2026353 RepID=A0A853CCF8_9ACTN|nr:SHOCT domain-containing protein [Petropleomorpha daqingensis]NYJ05444.1 hypothetical protein [Petropleomorpha daqingensis]
MRSAQGRGRSGPSLLGTAAPVPAAPPQGPPAVTAAASVEVQLTKLAELRQVGLLTDEEFATYQARLLAP